MVERILRVVVIILALIASGVHFYLTVSSFMKTGFDPLVALWLLNAVGYLGLLAAYMGLIAFFRGEDIIGYSLMVYAVVTIIAWWNIDDRTGILGWLTAADEILLAVIIFFHMRIRPRLAFNPDPDQL